MSETSFLRGGQWAIALVILCTPFVVTAEDGRDFAGFYAVRDVTGGSPGGAEDPARGVCH